jgi:hypothetical protein
LDSLVSAICEWSFKLLKVARVSWNSNNVVRIRINIERSWRVLDTTLILIFGVMVRFDHSLVLDEVVSELLTRNTFTLTEFD